MPAYLAGSLVFAVAMPLYYATKFWFARDTMTTFLPENFGVTPVEAELLRLDEAQLLEVLRPAR